MSTDPEASPFEEALRADLPSAETEARLRRRLLAAGLAVGNGVATTTAAAAGAAGSSAASGGLVANVVGLSWGIKLGFAAAVAIPTLGLLIDSNEPPSAARPAKAAASVAIVGGTRLEPPAPAPPSLVASVSLPPAELPARVTNPAASLSPRRDALRPLAEAAPAVAPIPEPPVASQGVFAAPPAAPESRSPSQTTLGEETRLLDAAFAELAAGHRARAARLIAEHESRYPHGLLSKERERAKTRLSELSQGD